MALDILIRLLSSGGAQVKSEIQGVAGAAKSVDSELKKIGANGGLNKAGASAEALAGKLQGVRNAGLAIAAVGAVGMALA